MDSSFTLVHSVSTVYSRLFQVCDRIREFKRCIPKHDIDVTLRYMIDMYDNLPYGTPFSFVCTLSGRDGKSFYRIHVESRLLDSSFCYKLIVETFLSSK